MVAATLCSNTAPHTASWELYPLEPQQQSCTNVAKAIRRPAGRTGYLRARGISAGARRAPQVEDGPGGPVIGRAAGAAGRSEGPVSRAGLFLVRQGDGF